MRFYSCIGAASIALCCISASAATLTVSENGTFSSSTPTSSFSAPGGAFTLSFDIASQPAVLASSATSFTVGLSNFTYTLNGLNQNLNPALATFFTSNDGGLFGICLNATTCGVNPVNGFNFFGAQAFSGQTSSPTILTGNYIQGAGGIPGVIVSNSYYPLASFSNVTIATAATPTVTPEPSTFALLGTGLLGVVGAMRRRNA